MANSLNDPFQYPAMMNEMDNAATVRAGKGSMARVASSTEPVPDNPAVLTWIELTVTERTKNMVLLKGVSGQISGGFWAVMGPSGSGKSTLLNALALRSDYGVKVEGHVRLNGREYDSAELKLMSGYVMQDDVLNGNLSVEETLTFTARLRCPDDTTVQQRLDRVERVMRLTGIEHARNTLVGSPLKKGISGGERKRLSVALELLMEPKLLFLDEPTSGLDSVTALSLCSALRELSSLTTIVTTIHQPQAKIFNMFHAVVLLQAGEIVFQGPTNEALALFEERNGMPCPPNANPADFLLDSITVSRSSSSHSLTNLGDYRERQGVIVDLRKGAEKPRLQRRQVVPWTRQYGILLERTSREQLRQVSVLGTQILQSIAMAILVGAAWLKLGNDQASVSRRQPLLFFCVINQGIFGALQTINCFPGERMLSLRERAAGTYYASAYFLARISFDTVVQLAQAFAFSIIVYLFTGLQAEVSKFFIFSSFMCLCTMAATSIALLVSAFCRTTDFSVTVLPMVLEVFRLFGGFFISPKNLPTHFVWLDALSYVKYTFIGVSINENAGLELTCTDDELVVENGVEQCPFPNGEAVLAELGMSKWSIGQCAGILIAYILLVRVAAFVGVRHVKW